MDALTEGAPSEQIQELVAKISVHKKVGLITVSIFFFRGSLPDVLLSYISLIIYINYVKL